ncbi:MAG: AmpG family muropeptide MFS transporter [Bdellovibrionales bacterium]|nr:AmpG family muropeptide MFS transporter [Bdellovibrionales bacterium]
MWKTLFSKRMIITFVMGFASGLPLLLTISVLQAWMKDANVDLGKIGLITLVGLPYSWKFVWAPLFDRFSLGRIGRRRGWLLLTQVLLTLTIIGLGQSNPAENLTLLAAMATLVAFLSASQDIVIDAYRRELLPDEELGLGSSVYVYGYRIGMLLASGGGLILADHYGYATTYLIMGLSMLPAIACTWWAPEPQVEAKPPSNFRESVIDPFVEFFKRHGSVTVLIFILLYKIGDTMASAITTPFYMDLGFSKTEIGAVTKLFGFWATIAGTFLGGVLIVKLKTKPSLMYFGIFQGVSTAGFAALAVIGYSLPALTAVIFIENLSAGMGTAAYMGFMAAQTNKKFTATQYALFTSLMGVPRTLLSSPTGYMAESMGWTGFFVFCTLIAIPGLILIRRIGD